jgi:hypothetical protein
MNTAVPRYYRLDVEVTPERVGQVGRILAAYLRYWDLEDLVAPVRDGVGRLLTAIDAHAKDKRASLEMWWNGQHLITAVGGDDRDLRPDPHLRDCLRHLAAVSDGWGCCATQDGAKVVWFSQRARSGERVPRVPVTPVPAVPEALDLPRERPGAPQVLEDAR